MEASQVVENSPELSGQEINRAWELAYASNVAYDSILEALGDKAYDADGEKNFTAKDLLADKVVDADMGNEEVGIKRDMFKRLVGLANRYALMDYSPYASPLEAVDVPEEGEAELAEIVPIDQALAQAEAEAEEIVIETGEGPGAEAGSEAGDASEEPMTAAGKTYAEVEEFTQSIIDGEVAHLDNIHRDYQPGGRVSKDKERKILEKRAKYHITQGRQEVEVTLSGRDLVRMPDELRLSLLVGQMNGPRRKRLMNTEDKRRQYMLSMLNVGRESYFTEDYLDVMLAQGVEKGDFFVNNDGRTDITEMGIKHLRAGLGEVMKEFKSTRVHF